MKRLLLSTMIALCVMPVRCWRHRRLPLITTGTCVTTPIATIERSLASARSVSITVLPQLLPHAAVRFAVLLSLPANVFVSS